MLQAAASCLAVAVSAAFVMRAGAAARQRNLLGIPLMRRDVRSFPEVRALRRGWERGCPYLTMARAEMTGKGKRAGMGVGLLGGGAMFGFSGVVPSSPGPGAERSR